MTRRCAALILVLSSMISVSQAPSKTYENSVVIAPLYAEYLSDSAGEFARQAQELKQRVGGGQGTLLGFAAFLKMEFRAADLNQPLGEKSLKPTLDAADLIVERARTNGLVAHIAIMSGFFHGTNDLRRSAILHDVRNAQWFSDGWIGEPGTLTNAANVPPTVWTTPSRYARTLRLRIEEGVRRLGSHLARRMTERPETFVTASGDGEVEFSYERNIENGERRIERAHTLYADYSPFMVEEFRDWL